MGLPLQLRRIAHNCLLLVIGLVAGFFLAEVAVRLALPQRLVIEPRNLYEINPGLGYRMRPHFEGQWRTVEYSTSIRTNAIGLRDYEIGEKEATAFRILVLGDSFTFSAGTELVDTYAKVLERSLREVSQRKVEVINAGVEGYGPEHYLQFLKETSLAVEPDLVIVGFYVANDVSDRISRNHYIHDGYLRSKQSRFSLKHSVLYPLNNVLEQRSHLFVLLRTRLDYVLWRLGLRPYYFPEVFSRKYGEGLRERWAFTLRKLDRIAKITGDNDGDIALVLIPTAYQVNGELWGRYLHVYGIDQNSVDLEKPQRILRRWGEKRRVPVLDLLPQFRREATNRDLYYKIDRHWNRHGNALAGHEIATFLRIERLVPAEAIKRASAVPRVSTGSAG